MKNASFWIIFLFAASQTYFLYKSRKINEEIFANWRSTTRRYARCVELSKKQDKIINHLKRKIAE